MKKAGINKKQLLKVALIVLLMIFLVFSALLILDIWERERGKFPEREILDETLEYNGEEYVLKDDTETFLVMGVDKGKDEISHDSYNNNRQTDFIMLFVFDNEKKECSAIHINRDTMASINVLGVNGNRVDSRTAQIALAHTYGNGRDVSCRNVADAVSELLLGMKVNHYISFTMDSIAVINDLVGGVELEILDDFTMIDPALAKGETVRLSGEQATSYVRERRELENPENSARMVRQQQYINALWDKAAELFSEDERFIADSAFKLSEYIVSDRSVTQLEALAEKIAAYEFLGITSLEGDNFLGEEFIEFYPHEDSVLKNVAELFYEPKK